MFLDTVHGFVACICVENSGVVEQHVESVLSRQELANKVLDAAETGEIETDDFDTAL